MVDLAFVDRMLKAVDDVLGYLFTIVPRGFVAQIYFRNLLMVAQLSSCSLLSSLLGHPVRLLNLSRIAWRNVRSGRQARWKGRSYSV